MYLPSQTLPTGKTSNPITVSHSHRVYFLAPLYHKSPDKLAQSAAYESTSSTNASFPFFLWKFCVWLLARAVRCVNIHTLVGSPKINPGLLDMAPIIQYTESLFCVKHVGETPSHRPMLVWNHDSCTFVRLTYSITFHIQILGIYVDKKTNRFFALFPASRSMLQGKNRKKSVLFCPERYYFFGEGIPWLGKNCFIY